MEVLYSTPFNFQLSTFSIRHCSLLFALPLDGPTFHSSVVTGVILQFTNYFYQLFTNYILQLTVVANEYQL